MADRNHLQGPRTTSHPHHTLGDQRATLDPHHTPGVREPPWVLYSHSRSESHAGSHHTLRTQELALTGVFPFQRDDLE